jgi:hypothetical protein
MNLALITDPMVGGTFLSWSLYYLTGCDQYWHHRSGCYRPLPENPLNGLNAHNFESCQAQEPGDVESLIHGLSQRHQDSMHVIYMHNFNEHLQPLGSTARAILDLQSAVEKSIVLTGGIDSGRFNLSMRSRALTRKILDPSQRNLSDQEQHQDYIAAFFSDDLKTWQDLGLTDVWDYREFLALNLSPGLFPSVGNLADLHSPRTCLLPCRKLWTGLDMPALLKFLGVPITDHRIDQWQTVYHQWQQQIQSRVQFVIWFDEIVRCILNGEDLDLLHLDLDLVQESLIQNALIYDHGLNLRTWQLERFESTQQLHALLEQNQHPVKKTQLIKFL